MAELKGSNAAIATGVNGASKIPSGEHVGRVRCLYDEYDFTTVGTGAADTILIGGKLQAGARVLEAVIASSDLGGAGTFHLGWQANLQDALDADGFIASADTSGQAAKVEMQAGAPGLGKKFESETQVFLTSTGVVASGANKIIRTWLYYVLD